MRRKACGRRWLRLGSGEAFTPRRRNKRDAFMHDLVAYEVGEAMDETICVAVPSAAGEHFARIRWIRSNPQRANAN